MAGLTIALVCAAAAGLLLLEQGHTVIVVGIQCHRLTLEKLSVCVSMGRMSTVTK